eukprot:TRINITY_DN77828_c0_g1_i1.p1 TRINITY_DN77828_c0_g1~~TRINITY_DN77828_c0_g1_i1.p1  ORF type:complete len:201 (-),score=23.02 TRINITY_DN77828_c0_g1_i1:208-774(-)
MASALASHSAFQQDAWQLQKAMDRQDQVLCRYRNTIHHFEKRRHLAASLAERSAFLAGSTRSCAGQFDGAIADILTGGPRPVASICAIDRFNREHEFVSSRPRVRHSGLIGAIAAETPPASLSYFEGVAARVDAAARAERMREALDYVTTMEMAKPARVPQVWRSQAIGRVADVSPIVTHQSYSTLRR